MTIGNKIKKIRELKNYTQEHLAEKLGMSLAGYGKIERDETDISYSRLHQIAEALSVSVEDIVCFDARNAFNLTHNKFKDFIVNNNVSPKERELYDKTIKTLEEKITLQEEIIAGLKEQIHRK